MRRITRAFKRKDEPSSISAPNLATALASSSSASTAGPSISSSVHDTPAPPYSVLDPTTSATPALSRGSVSTAGPSTAMNTPEQGDLEMGDIEMASDREHWDADAHSDLDSELELAIAQSLETSRAESSRRALEDGNFQPSRKSTRVKQQETPAASPRPAHETGSKTGLEGWKYDVAGCRKRWAGEGGEVEGYVGLIATVAGFGYGESENSVELTICFGDMDGDEHTLRPTIVFEELKTYPSSYKVLIYADAAPRRIAAKFTRFTRIRHLSVPTLITRLISSLQGDDDAVGHEEEAGGDGEDEDEEEDGMDLGDEGGERGRGFEVIRDGLDMTKDWGKLKLHFEQAKSMGYRPGLTRYMDRWIISYSIPLKNLPIDPNTLAMWDDRLVDAWSGNQRFTLIMSVGGYPCSASDTKYWLGFYPTYKPDYSEIRRLIRDEPPKSFYLSSQLLIVLKSFERCFVLRTSYGFDWATADRIGMDDDLSRQVLQKGQIPDGVTMATTSEGIVQKILGKSKVKSKKEDEEDPVARGFEENVPLCVFYWTLRRFMEAPKYCLNCGLEVAIPSVRPYVCDKPLCLYAFMSLGLGPSVEYVIRTHPAVVDMLLSFAYFAALTTTRMELPLYLHIEVPAASNLVKTPTLLDDLPLDKQRTALCWLIEQLPRVSAIRTHLESGAALHKLDVPPGSLGVLRWAVGSCKAYLKETGPEEGVQTTYTDAYGSTTKISGEGADVKQFTFVVGSPEQEKNFKDEIEKAKKATYPTMLAFHGSGSERWHNILRTGLDFHETANGRAYGNGVYFANDISLSMGSYARATTVVRPNADFHITKAAALVELVNVPETFVSHNPYYVVANTRQIKPFLLLVKGTLGVTEEEQTKDAERLETESKTVKPTGSMFQHDPRLKQKPLYYNQPLKVRMPDKLKATKLKDVERDDSEDMAVFNPPPPSVAASIAPAASSSSASKSKPAPKKDSFEPSPESRFAKLQMMPPPTTTSTVATKTLGREMKEIVKRQGMGELPFYIHTDMDGTNLYCWMLELHEFPDSEMMKQMAKLKIKSIVTELRFSANYPQTPPFMRILHPRFLPFSLGGGGHITAGGSICHELLTATGWSIAYSIEAVIRDVMVNMTESEPAAKIDMSRWDQPYSLSESVEAYKRVATAHGWEIPKDLDKIM